MPDGFYGYNYDEQTTIDSAYVSGVAVMYGSLDNTSGHLLMEHLRIF